MCARSSASVKLRLLAPAKLNLWLKVTGKRPDGYHELDTLMCPVSLFDELELETTDVPGIRLTVTNRLHQQIPADKSNLAYRAAECFYKQLKRMPLLDIKLDKHIPAGAGLGGGSSNAASVLYGLNELHDRPFAPRKLAQIALSLGADVPFFLRQAPARATGIGEILEPVPPLPPLIAVIIYPGFSVSTAQIYQNLKMPLTNDPKHSICSPAKMVAPFNLRQKHQNDLETAALALYPEITEAKAALTRAGFKFVLMSGSGSAVFGLCEYRALARLLARRIKIKSGWHVFIVEILNRFAIVP